MLGPMVRVRVDEVVDAPVEQVLSLVMDIERYARVDEKIRPVLWHRRDGNVVRFACRPKLVGLRQPKVVQYAQLTPGERIDIGLMPLPANRLAHAVARFRASFECRPFDDQQADDRQADDRQADGQQADGQQGEHRTHLVRTLEFEFTPALRWLLEPLLRRRLEPEVREEVRRAKQHLEQQHG